VVFRPARKKKGIVLNRVNPINSQSFRPHRSDNNPNSGLRINPVIVETETMAPISSSPAPTEAAKRGIRGVLPT